MLTDASLPPACRTFRVAFETGAAREHEHPKACLSCAAWAIHRQAILTARREPKPLPSALGARLRAIPTRATSCVAAEGLVRAARMRARGGESDAAVWAHVAGCARCRGIQTSLAAAFAVSRRTLPHDLETHLLRVGLRGMQQSWSFAFDLRAASLAAMLVGLLLVPIAGPTAALARDAGQAVSEPLAQAHENGSSELSALLDLVRVLAADARQGSQSLAEDLMGSLSALSSRTYASFRRIVTTESSQTPDEINPRGGDRHDE